MSSKSQVENNPVDHPSHYTQFPVECIEITEKLNFCMGNAMKYIWRADSKGKPIEDLKKAVWYLNREIERRRKEHCEAGRSQAEKISQT